MQFLSEAELSASQMRDVPDAVVELMNRLPADVIVREQYLDFFRNRMFRQTLLVHDRAPVNRRLSGAALECAWIASPAELRDGAYRTEGGSVKTNDPGLVAMLEELIARWPEPLAFDELASHALARAGAGKSAEAREHLRVQLLELWTVHVVQLSGVPRLLGSRAGPRPTASPLARAQAAAGQPVVSTLFPSNYMPSDDDERRLIGLLDGIRTIEQLAAELDSDAETVAARLEHLARQGLLLARP